MKKGKTSKLQGFKKMKAVYGTVDSINFKSCYLNIQTWATPTKHSTNWNRIILNMSRDIKHLIHETLDNSVFKYSFIVDLDLRSSGIELKKQSFLNLEINFYLNQNELDFKSSKLKSNMLRLSKDITQQILNKNEYFKFSLKKSVKEKLTQSNIL